MIETTPISGHKHVLGVMRFMVGGGQSKEDDMLIGTYEDDEESALPSPWYVASRISTSFLRCCADKILLQCADGGTSW